MPATSVGKRGAGRSEKGNLYPEQGQERDAEAARGVPGRPQGGVAQAAAQDRWLSATEWGLSVYSTRIFDAYPSTMRAHLQCGRTYSA